MSLTNSTKFRVKSLSLHAERYIRSRGWKRPFSKYERAQEKNEAVMRRLFLATMSGEIKGFYLVSDKSFKAYHRSPKHDGKVQLSSGYYKNGTLYPTFDIQMGCVKDMEREGYPSGTWRIIE